MNRVILSKLLNLPSKGKYIYVLALGNQQDKYFYVGSTQNLRNRIVAHYLGSGSQWIKMHKLSHIEKTIQCKLPSEQNMWTKQFMWKYGVDRVRGGSYCQLKLSSQQLAVLEMERRHDLNLCLNCGQPGHYSKICKIPFRPYRPKEPQISVDHTPPPSEQLNSAAVPPYLKQIVVFVLICFLILKVKKWWVGKKTEDAYKSKQLGEPETVGIANSIEFHQSIRFTSHTLYYILDLMGIGAIFYWLILR